MHKILLSTVVIILCFINIKADITYNISFDQSAFKLEDRPNGKIFIHSDEVGVTYGVSGFPRIPLFTRTYALPYGSKASSVTISYAKKELIKENVDLESNPLIYETSERSQPIDLSSPISSYDINKLIDTSFWCGVPIAHIQVTPYIYDEEIRVCTLQKKFQSLFNWKNTI